jgi:hypothetical protein
MSQKNCRGCGPPLSDLLVHEPRPELANPETDLWVVWCAASRKFITKRIGWIEDSRRTVRSWVELWRRIRSFSGNRRGGVGEAILWLVVVIVIALVLWWVWSRATGWWHSL